MNVYALILSSFAAMSLFRVLVKSSILSIVFTTFISIVCIFVVGIYEISSSSINEMEAICYFSLVSISLLFKPDEKNLIPLVFIPIVLILSDVTLKIGAIVVFSMFFRENNGKTAILGAFWLVYTLINKIYFDSLSFMLLTFISSWVYVTLNLFYRASRSIKTNYFEFIIYLIILFQITQKLEHRGYEVFVLVTLGALGLYLSIRDKVYIYWTSKALIIFSLLCSHFNLITALPLYLLLEVFERGVFSKSVAFGEKQIEQVKKWRLHISFAVSLIVMLAFIDQLESNLINIALVWSYLVVMGTRIFQIEIKDGELDTISFSIILLLIISSVVTIL